MLVSIHAKIIFNHEAQYDHSPIHGGRSRDCLARVTCSIAPTFLDYDYTQNVNVDELHVHDSLQFRSHFFRYYVITRRKTETCTFRSHLFGNFLWTYLFLLSIKMDDLFVSPPHNFIIQHSTPSPAIPISKFYSGKKLGEFSYYISLLAVSN